MPISDCMRLLADVNGYIPTDKLEKIARAKEKLFGEEPGRWIKCPCDKNNPAKYCISPFCKQTIEETGTCCCGAYRKG